jgi:hypothetical protein
VSRRWNKSAVLPTCRGRLRQPVTHLVRGGTPRNHAIVTHKLCRRARFSCCQAPFGSGSARKWPIHEAARPGAGTASSPLPSGPRKDEQGTSCPRPFSGPALESRPLEGRLGAGPLLGGGIFPARPARSRLRCRAAFCRWAGPQARPRASAPCCAETVKKPAKSVP